MISNKYHLNMNQGKELRDEEKAIINQGAREDFS